MSDQPCERCAGDLPTAYAVSPFPRVGGFWLCAPCRAAWRRAQEAPSRDTASPPVDPAVRGALIRCVVWTRARTGAQHRRVVAWPC